VAVNNELADIPSMRNNELDIPSMRISRFDEDSRYDDTSRRKTLTLWP